MDWGQLRTILWLRWRLIRNQWSRSGPLNAVLTMIVAIVIVVVGAAGGIGGMLAGALGLAKARPLVLLGVWDAVVGAFLFFWMIGIVSEIQRSEMIDIRRLLHLPVSLRDIFIVNYLASHLTFGIFLFVPGMLGLCSGWILGEGPVMVCMAVLVLGFLFMITAWTYCLRGWLITLMVNPRRRRAVIAGMTFIFIMMCQLPNLFNIAHNQKRHHPPGTPTVESSPQDESPTKDKQEKHIPQGIMTAHRYVPFLWVGYGAMSLAQGHALPALWGAAGSFILGAWGLRRAYRTTVRFYQGQATGRKILRTKRQAKVSMRPRSLLERELPWVSRESGTLALAFFRNLTRASEIKMMLATQVFMLLFFGFIFVSRRSRIPPDIMKPFIATGVVAVTFFGTVQLMFNLFGSDRQGFRSLVLLPVSRKQILLGKNLAILPITLVIGITFLIFIKMVLQFSMVFLLGAGLQLGAAFLLLSMVGNLVSVLVPFRIAPGSLKPTKYPALKTFLILLAHMLFPMMMVPLFLAPGMGLLLSRVGWMPAAWAYVLTSGILLFFCGFFYRWSLPFLGHLLQAREKKILEVVTREVE